MLVEMARMATENGWKISQYGDLVEDDEDE